jgi:hypothetical protein
MQVTLGDDPCLLLSCNASALSCAVTPTSSGMRNVSLELTDGDGNATLATALLSGAQVQVLPRGTASPRILSVIPDILPAAGGESFWQGDCYSFKGRRLASTKA